MDAAICHGVILNGIIINIVYQINHTISTLHHILILHEAFSNLGVLGVCLLWFSVPRAPDAERYEDGEGEEDEDGADEDAGEEAETLLVFELFLLSLSGRPDSDLETGLTSLTVLTAHLEAGVFLVEDDTQPLLDSEGTQLTL